ncbi:MAG: hypothetical protein Q7T41_01435 [Candidatus Saccharibacteria bacterium]|nr:hypothetical protein [Candidatus Saccharibacteria bacterium]
MNAVAEPLPPEAIPQLDTHVIPEQVGMLTLRVLDLERTDQTKIVDKPIFLPDGNTVKTTDAAGNVETMMVPTEVPELLPLPDDMQYQDRVTGKLHGEAGPNRKHSRNHPLGRFKIDKESYLQAMESSSLQFSPRAKKEYLWHVAKVAGEHAAMSIRKILLLREPRAPFHLTNKAAQERKPTREEMQNNPISNHDGVRIKIDKLQEARQKGETEITLEKMRDYISGVENGTLEFDHEFDKFVKESAFVDHQAPSTKSEIEMVHAIHMLDRMFSAEDLGGLERLTALANKKGVDDITATQSTGPDFRIRILFARRNADGKLIDQKGHVMKDHNVISRAKLIKKASEHPEFVSAAILYELTKQQTYFNRRLWQDAVNLMKECGFSDSLIQDTWMGITYARKYQNTDMKNTLLEHPVLKDADGNEIWDPLLDSDKKQQYINIDGDPVSLKNVIFRDRDGNIVQKAAGDIDMSGLTAYHRKKKDDHGVVTYEETRMTSEILYGPDGKPLYRVDPLNPKNADGSPNYLMIPVMEDDNVTQRLDDNGDPMFMRDVQRQLEAAYTPRIDWDDVMIGNLKDEEWTNELATRIVSGQLQWETDTVKKFLLKVMEYSEQMDEDYYQPGFYVGKGVDARGRLNKAHGRQSETYLTNARFMTRLKKLVDSTRFGSTTGEKDDAKREAQLEVEMQRRAEIVRKTNEDRAAKGEPPLPVEQVSSIYPPKLQSAAPEAQAMFEEVAKIVDAIAARHKLGEVRWNDQSAI